MDERLAGLFSRHRGKIASQQTAKLEAQILAAARQKPKDGSTHWSTRKLAAELGTNHTRVPVFWPKPDCTPTPFAATWPATTHIFNPTSSHHWLVPKPSLPP